MDATKIYPGTWISADALPDQNVDVSIKKFCFETLADGTEKPVLYFHETERGLILNKTNNKTMIKIHGKETDDWIGKLIRLIKQQVSYMGEQVMAVRVSLEVPEKPNIQLQVDEPEPVPPLQ